MIWRNIKANSLTASFLTGFLLWFFIAIASAYTIPHIIGIRLTSAFVLHALTILVLIKIVFFKPKIKNNLILWFLALNLWLFFVDLFFYIAAFANHSLLINISFLNFLFYYAPCVIYCIFTVIFIAKILLKQVLNTKGFSKIVSALLIMNAIVMLLFLASIHYAFSFISWEIISQIVLLSAELILFDFTILGLIYAINISASLFLSGVVSLICGDFLLTYSYLSQTSYFFACGGVLWLLGLLFIFFSVISMDYYRNYTTENWFRKNTAIKSHLTFWCFNISCGSFLIFFIFSYFFPIINHQIFIELPLFIMAYSVMSIVFSLIIGTFFERPFAKIQSNIKKLTESTEDFKLESFSINEFQSLQNFLTEIFKIKSQKNLAVQELNIAAVKMIQEIQAPLSTLNNFVPKLFSVPEKRKKHMQRAIAQINDSATMLINKFKAPTSYSDILHQNAKPISIVALLRDIVAGKKLQFEKITINIIEFVAENDYTAVITVNAHEMRRALSNLINNAVESLKDNDGIINLMLHVESTTITIRISDNGCGISPEKLEKIFLPGVSFKENGTGLGLSHAKETIEVFEGILQLQSKENVGTHVHINIPRSQEPVWMKNTLQLPSNTVVAILDENTDMLDAYKSKLSNISVDLSINVFTSVETLFVWEKNQKSPFFLVLSYELQESYLNGLDIVEKLALKERAIIITDDYDKEEIIDRCEELKCYLWPKSLLDHFNITLI